MAARQRLPAERRGPMRAAANSRRQLKKNPDRSRGLQAPHSGEAGADRSTRHDCVVKTAEKVTASRVPAPTRLSAAGAGYQRLSTRGFQRASARSLSTRRRHQGSIRGDMATAPRQRLAPEAGKSVEHSCQSSSNSIASPACSRVMRASISPSNSSLVSQIQRSLAPS